MDASPPNRPRKPRRRWRWHVPPALVHGGEGLEGAQVLDEMEGRLGLVLWETYRDVLLWGGTGPEERAGLFAAGAHDGRLAAIEAAGADSGVQRALQAIAEIVRSPEDADELEVMGACRQVADWAEQRQLLATAVAFAAAAAVAAPANAAAAFRVGQITRRAGEGARAETWFRRAIGLGRQARDWESYAEAFIGLGNLYKERGNYPAARRLHIRGLRAARRHALRDAQARALHDLFCIAVETGPRAEAEELAGLAFRAYGSRNPRLPALAHDVGYFWMSEGRFEPALEVFRAVLPHLRGEGERLLCAGNLARAAGACGVRPEFEAGWERIWEAEAEWERIPSAAQALLELAHGASTLRDWARAERAAERARELAHRRNMGQVVIESDVLIEAARRKRAIPPAARPEAAEQTEELKSELVRSLAPRRGAADSPVVA
jgi:tetratricopeptide (TPR) repeat protein